MAVYTVLDREEIEAFIEPYGVGPLLDYEGVAAGIENTNYFISTDQSEMPSEFRTKPVQDFVLTIFEQISEDELKFYIELTTLLNLRGLPVPCPVKNADGVAMGTLHNKPALLVPKFQGSHPEQPSVGQCAHIGEILANIHQVTIRAGLEHQSNRNLVWVKECIQAMRDELSHEELMLTEELPRFFQLVEQHPDLPMGIIHGDLFRDNALADGNQITGIIDFNSAGTGYVLMDLAVVTNDWCSRADGSLDHQLAQALISAYQQVRSFTADESALWNDFLRVAAMRFWVSRRFNQFQPENDLRPGGLVEQKDPTEFKTILNQRIHHPYILG